jgi:hypothetical protein
MIILVVIALAAAVLAYVSYPLWAPAESKPAVAATALAKPRSKSGARSTPRPSSPAPQPSTRASASVEVADAEELDLDRETGRLDEADYAALRGGPAAVSAGQEQQDDREDDEIEQRVRALRQERARRGPRPTDGDGERR